MDARICVRYKRGVEGRSRTVLGRGCEIALVHTRRPNAVSGRGDAKLRRKEASMKWMVKLSAAMAIAVVLTAGVALAANIRCDGGVCNGTSRGDTLRGSAKPDRMNGLGGLDRMNGNRANDVMFGGSGSDNMFGSFGKDELSGGGGSDTLSGDEDRDRLTGGSDADTLAGAEAQDRLTGGSGSDTLRRRFRQRSHIRRGQPQRQHRLRPGQGHGGRRPGRRPAGSAPPAVHQRLELRNGDSPARNLRQRFGQAETPPGSGGRLCLSDGTSGGLQRARGLPHCLTENVAVSLVSASSGPLPKAAVTR